MAQNFLYMFEFVVDDILISRPNYCAPEEYPMCCELSFRSSVFVSICDREYGHCVDTGAPKCGKCCLFSLESPVTDKDRLLIHIYKKKTDKCKFLIGATELPIKPLFDKVTMNFDIENPKWMEALAKHTARLPNPKTASKTTVVDNDCDEDPCGRKEQMCATSEMTKRLLPLYNMKNMQTGNVVLIMRLVCNGPAIVSSFPFSTVCPSPCKKSSCQVCPSSEPPPPCSVCPMPDPCRKDCPPPPVCKRYFSCNSERGCPCDDCEDDLDRECPAGCKKNKPKKPKCGSCRTPTSQSGCSSKDTCKAPEQKPDSCQRYFDATKVKPCACEECVDDCEAEESSEEESLCMQPCFVTPRPPEPGPEAYEEFEACLNGSGLVIRVLKDTHQVEGITDGTEQFHDSGSECDKGAKEDNGPKSQCDSLSEILQRSSFAKNHIKRRTAGHIVNHPNLPKIRANIKYAGNESCCSDTYHVPYSKIKDYCDNQENKVELYRRRKGDDGCGPLVPPRHPSDIRNCCLQVDPLEIKNALKGINMDTRKKGIEVCYKTCEDTDSDVFLVKLGSKQRCQRKKNSIEIELKTPKQPITLPKQKVTTETQINEQELDAALAGACSKKKKGKGKGKKGKK